MQYSEGLKNYFEEELDSKEQIVTNYTYPEIRKIVRNNDINLIDKSTELYNYFINEIYPRMIKIASSKNKDNSFNLEYAIMNQMGVIIFAMPETPFAKLFLNEVVTNEEEYLELISYLKSFIEDYGLGTFVNNKFGFSINFNTNIEYAIDTYYMELQRLDTLTHSHQTKYDR